MSLMEDNDLEEEVRAFEEQSQRNERVVRIEEDVSKYTLEQSLKRLY